MITNLANAQRRALMGPLGKTLGLMKTPQRCKSEIFYHPLNLFLLLLVFRASQPLNNEFNVYIDGKAVPVSKW